MALTEEQLQHYYREGYVVPGLIPTVSVASVLAAAPPAEGEGGGWGAHIYNHRNPETQAGIHRLRVEPGIVDAARSIFGNEPRILYGMLAIVKARGGTGLPWHQDNQYTQVLGGALNIFAALCDITPAKAILWVARVPIGLARSLRRKALYQTRQDIARRWSNRKTECRCLQ